MIFHNLKSLKEKRENSKDYIIYCSCDIIQNDEKMDEVVKKAFKTMFEIIEKGEY